MNRIDRKFVELKSRGKKAFVAFITAGDPSLRETEKLVPLLEDAGVDIVELGVPFSDPLADGPTIQASSYRALRKGVTLEKILASVKNIRKKTDIPVALMTYYNPVFHFGEDRFTALAVECGVDGLIIPDLPPEEAAALIRRARKRDLSTVFFIAPTTRKDRIAKIAGASTGFIYYVSLTGVTGARKKFTESISSQIRLVKSVTAKPVCVGFGISTPEQVKTAAGAADGVIVGSAIIKIINKHAGEKDMAAKVSGFVKGLTRVLNR